MKKSIFILLLTLVNMSLYSQEICDNGIDDDLDGLIDLQDTTDCFCQLSNNDSTTASLIPNPSFEQRTCCPTGASQLNCANNWIQASGATSDYFNTCGLQAIGTFPPPPTPLPDGVGYVGFFDDYFAFASSIIYKEYVGTCLTDTMKIGVNYQIEFFLANSFGNLSTEMAIYGTTNCTNLPFGNPLPTATSFCPTTIAPLDWTLLDMDTVTCSTSSWVKVTLNFTATQNYSAIILGPSCANNSGSNYYYVDNLILNESSLFAPNINIVDSGHYCRGNLILKATFDSIPNSFQWYRDSIAIVGETDSNYFVPNGGLGNYQVRLIYDSNCIITSSYLVDTTTINFDLDSSGSCPNGLATGEVLVTNFSGGKQPYDFSLNSNPFTNDSSFNQISPGLYTITVRDSNLCESSKQVRVESFPIPVSSFIADSVCLGQPTIFNDNSTLSSGTIIQWGWNTASSPLTQNTVFTYASDGIYSVTHTVVSDSGCIDDTTMNVVVNPLPNPNFSFSPQEIYTFNTDVCFTNLSSGAVSYLWDFDFAGINGNSINPNPCPVPFPNGTEKTYTVKLVAISNEGCIDSTEISVAILNEFLMYAPNSFTPNNDNMNDKFEIVAEGIASFEILIFNRWGELIFTSNNPVVSWDGKHQGKLVPLGNYIYKIRVKGENSSVRETVGHVNVIY